MEVEPPKKKICILVTGMVWAICFFAMGGTYISAYNNAESIDDAQCKDNLVAKFVDLCKKYDGKYYDNMYRQGPYKSEDEDCWFDLQKQIQDEG